MNRRDLLRAMALGGGIVAGELWIPDQRFISIPRPLTFARLRDDIEASGYLPPLNESSVERMLIDIIEEKGREFVRANLISFHDCEEIQWTEGISLGSSVPPLSLPWWDRD